MTHKIHFSLKKSIKLLIKYILLKIAFKRLYVNQNILLVIQHLTAHIKHKVLSGNINIPMIT